MGQSAYHRIVPIDLLHRGVMIFIGSLDSLRAILAEQDFSQDEREHAINTIKDLGTNSAAVTTILGGDVVIYAPQMISTQVLVHEIVHAVALLMRLTGIDDEEFRAYTTEYLFTMLHPFISSESSELHER